MLEKNEEEEEDDHDEGSIKIEVYINEKSSATPPPQPQRFIFIPFYHHEKHESVKSILLHFDPSFCTFPQFNRMCVYVLFSVLILFFPSSFSSFSLSLCRCCLEIHDMDKNGVDKLKEMETKF